MEEADKDWTMIRMVGGWVFILIPAHPGSPGQRAVKRLLCVSCVHDSDGIVITNLLTRVTYAGNTVENSSVFSLIRMR